ncbi:MAG: O-antigen ligase domain-containing protein [Gomphosphaeria aponina SAG 52.96 = DSM 107014]|uniref:O-antigen ligase domain-containing protein n=1 Tax=Gomphosphaeria aponina SAG 52.96 = DSM 107014 TaxID=1521640 RepID=A0A941JSA7_9CHRO|nr:O-antigen ligase domain-containing protein [Gomphosphaeria aponina SAG 52.96 = DSM 107014]
MTNGLGAYDGLNESITQTVTWGFPYLLGRLYLNSLDGLKELAINIIKGGILYVPLVLYEGRMSPQLHNIIYGYHAHKLEIQQAYRLGGYRPMVFMAHGLMLGMWMMVVALIGFWLWRAGTVKKIWGMSMNWLAPLLIFSFIWCRSTGAYGYLIYGLVIIYIAKWFKTGLPLLLLIFGICYYLLIAASGNFAGEEIVTWIADNINPERAESLEFRFQNEEILAEHARKQWILGWGGWGRNRVMTENWQGDLVDNTVTDSLWIIVFGVNGMVGLVSITLTLLLPAASFCWLRYPARTWLNPQVAPAAACAVVLTLYMLDCVLNNMFNPIFPLISGGLSGLVMKKPEKVRAKIPKLRIAKRQLVQHR